MLSSWLGSGLVAIVGVCALWLGFTGRLPTYIHPRYVVFTMVMAAIAVVASVAALAVTRWRDDDHEHDAHEHDAHEHDRHRPHRHRHPESLARRIGRGTATAVTVVVCTSLAAALVLLPPTALSASTAEIRTVNGGMLLSDTTDTAVELTASGDYSEFGLREWASLLKQSTHPESLISTPFSAIGFVTASPEDPENAFILTRFVVSCCAVDAQPVGVAVHSPGWNDDYAAGDWVSVEGDFGSNPDRTSETPVLVIPTKIAPTPQPKEPYEY